MKRIFFLLLLLMPLGVYGQGSMALAPARFELEMQPGTEKTVVINVDYKNTDATATPARIVASLNDWTMTRDGQVQFYPSGSRPGSASSWMFYSPGEASVAPGVTHQIRVTVSVPANAIPGDHLAALIIEQRPENLRANGNARQMIVRYRMASVFYIKVGGVTRKGDLLDLLAVADPDGIAIKPLLANQGNSVLRPTASVSISEADGKPVIDLPESEILPVLGGNESISNLKIDKVLPMGKYTVKCRIDFQNGQPAIEGVTDLVIRQTQIASSGQSAKKP
ncbi:MAG: hypothetical protein JO314_00435 [Acidobacteria bacterium]|nr:hypothetical protein [Acidobacteriota bacterium]